jgi:hypothetical protein
MRTLTTFEGCLRSMSIGPGTSAAASGVTIGSADADADGADEGGVPAAAGLSPSGLNAIAAPAAAVTAAATSAARRVGLTSLMGVLSLLWAFR